MLKLAFMNKSLLSLVYYGQIIYSKLMKTSFKTHLTYGLERTLQKSVREEVSEKETSPYPLRVTVESHGGGDRLGPGTLCGKATMLVLRRVPP